MAENHIGALAVTEGSDPNNPVIGIFSERDYLCKVAILGTYGYFKHGPYFISVNLGKTSRDTAVGEICTRGSENLVTVDMDEPIDECMKKMIERDIRHLLLRDDKGEIVSMMSIKDCVKVVVSRHNTVVKKLTDFALGKKLYYTYE